jgi:branched-chain amino acid transport system ATP-binding protein
MLSVHNVRVAYREAVTALHGISLAVPAGSIIALLGPNGAGKTTLLRTITGLLGMHRGRLLEGTVMLAGTPIQHEPPDRIVRRGVKQVLEGRRIFASFTVEENLRAGALSNRAATRPGLERVWARFPRLAEHRHLRAGYLSGGEQQMLALGRALMSEPRYLLLDEPSLGLSPLLVGQLGGLLTEINQQGTAVLLAEQNAAMALSVADCGYVLGHGRVVMHGPATALARDPRIRRLYFGEEVGAGPGEAEGRAER